MDDIENDKNSVEASRDIVELKEAKQVIDISKTDILDISGLDDEAKQQLQVKAALLGCCKTVDLPLSN